jgi:hypothetical protein
MDHARCWCDAGHEVTVVTCAPNFPHGKLFQGYRNSLYQEEWIDNVRVIRVWSYLASNAGFAKRILDQVSFMASAVIQSYRLPRFDVILASSPPLFVAMAGYMISKVWRRPWIFELRDLWPASIEAVGLGKKTPLRLLEKMELFLYRKADRIISLTDAFKNNLIQRGTAGDKIDVVTNGVDTDVFAPVKERDGIRKILGVPEKAFLVGYFGTTGMAHGLETLLEAAQRCENSNGIKFLIMGEGSERKNLEAKSQQLGLTNVIFHDFVPHKEMPNYYETLDLFIVHLKPHPVFETVIPSKIFEAMAIGTPILCAVQGEGAKIVSEADAGVCIPPGNSVIMANTILDLIDRPAALQLMGQSGRQAAVETFSRRSKALEALKSIERSVMKSGSG